LTGHAGAQEQTRLNLTSTPLGEPNVVLSQSSFDAASGDRPIVYYVAYGAEVLLPKHRLVFSPDTKPQTLKIADASCTIRYEAEKFLLTVPGKTVELKPAGLGCASVPVPLAADRQYLLAFPRAFSFKGDATLFCRSGFVQTATLGEDEIRLYDDDLDGSYTRGKDGLCVGDRGKAGIFAPVSELLPTTKAAYRIDEIAKDGSSVTLSPYAGETARLRIELAIKDVECRVALASEDGKCSFAMLAGDRPVTIPAGTYRFLYGFLYQPAARRAVALLLPGKGLRVTLAGNEDVTVTLGETLRREPPAPDQTLTTSFDAMLEVDLTGVEEASSAGDFAKAETLFKEIAAKHKSGPNYEATRDWMESLGQRLELETSREGAALRDAEGKVLAAVKQGNLPLAKLLLGDARKALEQIPARLTNYRAFRIRKARVDALGRYAEGNLPGLKAAYYDHRFQTKTGEEVVEKVDWDESPHGGRMNFFCCRYEGFLAVPEEGEYELFLASDEGARLWLDGEMVIDHWKSHVLAEKSVKMKLTAGLHPLKIEMFQALGGAALHFRWTPPGGRKSLVPVWALECRREEPQPPAQK
jgi:hypothetical protein